MQHNYIITNIRFCQVFFCSLFLFFLHSLPFLSPHVRRRFTMRKHHFTRAAHFTCRKANLTEKTPAAYAAGVLYRHRSIFPGRRQPSIFDTDELNFCVRYGNRCDLIAISTGFQSYALKTMFHSSNFKIEQSILCLCYRFTHNIWSSPRPISTCKLHASRRFHFRPINLVVFKGSYLINSVGYLILRPASRLDAFSVYPFRT